MPQLSFLFARRNLNGKAIRFALVRAATPIKVKVTTVTTPSRTLGRTFKLESRKTNEEIFRNRNLSRRLNASRRCNSFWPNCLKETQKGSQPNKMLPTKAKTSSL